MNNTKDISNVIWVYTESDKRAIAKKVMKKLNDDIASFILYNGEHIAIERYSIYIDIPDYLYNYIKKNEEDIISFYNYLEVHKNDPVGIA